MKQLPGIKHYVPEQRFKL